MQRKLTVIALGIGTGLGAISASTALAKSVAPAAPRSNEEAAAATRDPNAILLNQARLWQSRNRDDLARDTLEKLLRNTPDYADGIAQLAFVELHSNRLDKARQLLERLRTLSPQHPDIPRLDTLFRLEGPDKEQLRQARMLAKTGESEKALALFDKLYPSGPPTGDLALEYWQTAGDTSNGWKRALAGMNRLVAQYPDNPQYRLALAQLITVRRPNDSAALKTITDLTKDPRLENAARPAWRRAMLRLEPSLASVSLIENYLQNEKTDDTAVKEHLANIKSALERQRVLMADPYYRSGLDGLAMLDNGKLDAAEEKLTKSLEGRPADPQVLGGLGLLRMRQGHHAEAQAYFQEARQRDPGNSRWLNLFNTARYWGLLREASDALDASEYPLAEAKLKEAHAIDPRQPQAIIIAGKVLAAQGRNADAEKAFREVLSTEPANQEALQSLATLYLRNGREQDAEALLAKLSGTQKTELASTIAAVRAAMFKEKGDLLLAQGKQDEAIAMLESAAQYDQDDPWLRFQLARLYAERGAAEKGDALFSALLETHPEDASARYAYALFQSGQNKDANALDTLERIARKDRTANMSELQRRLWVRMVAQRAVSLAKAGRTSEADRLLDSAATAIGEDAERQLELADARIDIGNDKQANAQLEQIAGMPLSPEQRTTLKDLQVSLTVRKADELRRQGQTKEALQSLAPLRRAQPENERLLFAEARFARADKRFDIAEADYRALLQAKPDNRDAAIALIEILVQRRQAKDIEEARRLIDEQLGKLDTATPDQTADLVGALIDLGDKERAWQTLRTVPETSRTLSQASRLAQQDGKLDDAIQYLQLSLATEMSQRSLNEISALKQVSTTLPDGSTVPTLGVTSASRDAVDAEANAATGYRNLAELLDRKTTWLSGALEKRTRSGTAGMSRYDATEIPLELKHAEGPEGRWAVHADLVKLDAGAVDFSDTPNARLFGSTLLCQPNCNTGLFAQSANGLALNFALQRDDTRYDIGTTPLGFAVQSWNGGILHKGDLGPLGYSLDISRRPMTGSVLSYAGAHDPRTGLTWGGVQATGVRLGLSLDDGGRFGGWSSIGLHRLSGKNVLDNTRMQLMAGGSMRVINEDDRLLQFGLTGMLWHFSANDGEYTFGHGGYYSPESYKSLSLPVTYGERSARLSWAVRASMSVSRSDTDSAPYYPTDPAMQALAESRAASTGINPFYEGGPGRGVGRSLSLSWEYQMNPRAFFGGLLELDRSPDYAPNRFVLYWRYAVDRVAAKPVSFLPQSFGPASQY